MLFQRTIWAAARSTKWFRVSTWRLQETDMPGSASHVALMLTRRCNMTCSHCSVASGPQVGEEPQDAELLGYLRQAAAAGVKSLQITGGEPMLREKLLRLLRECQKLGVVSVMTTNGFWGSTLRDARRRVKALRRRGLGSLTVSYDRYHAEFQDHRPVFNIALAAEELNFPINVSIVRVAEDEELGPSSLLSRN